MSKIQVTNLTFRYEGGIEDIFKDVSFTLDTDWKLGLVGRNGKGKTTFLSLLLNKYSYQGIISKTVEFEYFPFEVLDKDKMTMEILEEIVPNFEQWKINKELNLLKADLGILYRPFNTLSGGEQGKVLLASLFMKENKFLLIDEPTNHMDIESRRNIQDYLNAKKGFILVSHDREFLDKTVDHILAINNTDITVTKGNYSVWKENKDRQDSFEQRENERLREDIEKLEIAVKNTSNWSDKVEATKYGTKNSGLRPDTGYIGHQSAKMMQRAKSIEKRQEKAINEKSNLLKNIDRMDSLTIKPLEYMKNELVVSHDLSIQYGDNVICENIRFEVNKKDRISISGPNGVGKSTILKLILGENINYAGVFKKGNDIKISYVSQSTENLKGTLRDIAKEEEIDEGIFKAMLSKLGMASSEFEKDVREFSEGQKKKVLLAKSISESAHLYIWDEPLNFIDIPSRIQLEEAILKYEPTLIFVEHDGTFVKNIATKEVKL